MEKPKTLNIKLSYSQVTSRQSTSRSTCPPRPQKEARGKDLRRQPVCLPPCPAKFQDTILFCCFWKHSELTGPGTMQLLAFVTSHECISSSWFADSDRVWQAWWIHPLTNFPKWENLETISVNISRKGAAGGSGQLCGPRARRNWWEWNWMGMGLTARLQKEKMKEITFKFVGFLLRQVTKSTDWVSQLQGKWGCYV